MKIYKKLVVKNKINKKINEKFIFVEPFITRVVK